MLMTYQKLKLFMPCYLGLFRMLEAFSSNFKIESVVIELEIHELKQVQEVLRQEGPFAKVWVFGSRAGGKIKPYSDLDLAIQDSQPLSLLTLGHLKERFAESDLPFSADVVDLSCVSEEFKRFILRKGALLATDRLFQDRLSND